MSEHYCRWVRLPRPVPLPAPVGRWFCFGRDTKAEDAKAGDAKAELAPGLLDDPDALLWNGVQKAPPEQLMLSQRHLNLRLDGNDWRVKLESATWPVYQLTQAGALNSVLSVENRGQEFAVQQGELLAVGGYLLELG